jgi:hypothetical protein
MRHGVEVTVRGADGRESNDRGPRTNCTYSRSIICRASNAEPIPAKHELTELALVEPPALSGGAAVTVMDGPFFSLMPYRRARCTR